MNGEECQVVLKKVQQCGGKTGGGVRGLRV